MTLDPQRSSIAPPVQPAHTHEGAHIVQFYEGDAFLLDAVDRYIGPALAEGDAAVVIATAAHRRGLAARLRARGLGLKELTSRGRYVALDAGESLVSLMVEGQPDPARFVEVVGAVIAQAASQHPQRRVHAFGEMVSLLYDDGKREAAIRLEELWNGLAKAVPFSLLCAYSIHSFRKEEDDEPFRNVCSQHSQVMPAEGYATLTTTSDRLRDITLLQRKASALDAETAERRSAEKSLALLAAEREELLRATERALAEAQAANRAKDEFLAMLGHELRNPLSAVRNAVVTARLDATRRDRALDIAQRQTERLSGMVDDLLDVARITQGKIVLNKERLLLADVIQRTVDAVRSLIEQQGQFLAVSVAEQKIVLEADPMRIEQVLMNLLANAARYGGAGNRISLRAELQGGEVVLRVSDHGMGIAPDMLPRVFDLFAQGDRSLDRVQGGLGIGLTIVKRLVELHGGRVEAHSDGLGKGAEFVVRLPLAPAADPTTSAAANERQDKSASRIRVLIVEDNVDSAESLSMLLELLGHEVVAVHDGHAALEAARLRRPDVMLVDIGLPGMDGYEVARCVRGDPELKHITLVALTGYGQEEDRRLATAAGFDHHHVKPIDPKELEGIIAGAGETRKESATVH